MPNYQGVWSLSEQYQAIGDQNWLMAPGAPTGVSATAASEEATVSFSAPSFTGNPAGITGYRVTSDPEAITATGSSSPITVSGLTNGTAYTFIVQAQNSIGYGAEGGPSGSVTPSLQRALLGGYEAGGFDNTRIDQLDMSTAGNSTDFGDLTVGRSSVAGTGGETRALFNGGTSTGANVIEFFTFASAGNASDFGDMTNSRSATAALSNATRGIIANGTAGTNVIQFVTIASTGNATDFGDTTASKQLTTGMASPTRGLIVGGDI
jgi:hypothetical protein